MLEIKIKKYQSLGNNAYKVLFESFSSAERSSLKDYEEALKKQLGKNTKVELKTLCNYRPLTSHGQFKTCIIYGERETMLVSKASLASKNFQTISGNMFLDVDTNKMWKKVVKNGVTSLVQELEEDLDAILKKRLDVSQAVAHLHQMQILAADKMDYMVFFDSRTKKIESGLKLGSEIDAPVYCKSTGEICRVSPYAVLSAAESPILKNLESELNKLKTSREKGKDALKIYLDFWFKSREGKNTSTQMDKALQNEILKQTASAENNFGSEWTAADDLQNQDLTIEEDEVGQDMIDEIKGENITKDELETFVKSTLDQTKLTSLVDVMEESGKLALRFTKEDFSISDYLYVIKSLQDFLPQDIEILTEETSEFVLVELAFGGQSEEAMAPEEISY